MSENRRAHATDNRSAVLRELRLTHPGYSSRRTVCTRGLMSDQARVRIIVTTFRSTRDTESGRAMDMESRLGIIASDCEASVTIRIRRRCAICARGANEHQRPRRRAAGHRSDGVEGPWAGAASALPVLPASESGVETGQLATALATHPEAGRGPFCRERNIQGIAVQSIPS